LFDADGFARDVAKVEPETILTLVSDVAPPPAADDVSRPKANRVLSLCYMDNLDDINRTRRGGLFNSALPGCIDDSPAYLNFVTLDS
jgi:hypothetical protein